MRCRQKDPCSRRESPEVDPNTYKNGSFIAALRLQDRHVEKQLNLIIKTETLHNYKRGL